MAVEMLVVKNIVKYLRENGWQPTAVRWCLIENGRAEIAVANEGEILVAASVIALGPVDEYFELVFAHPRQGENEVTFVLRECEDNGVVAPVWLIHDWGRARPEQGPEESRELTKGEVAFAALISAFINA